MWHVSFGSFLENVHALQGHEWLPDNNFEVAWFLEATFLGFYQEYDEIISSWWPRRLKTLRAVGDIGCDELESSKKQILFLWSEGK
jgi:hypothetical protein